MNNQFHLELQYSVLVVKYLDCWHGCPHTSHQVDHLPITLPDQIIHLPLNHLFHPLRRIFQNLPKRLDELDTITVQPLVWAISRARATRNLAIIVALVSGPVTSTLHAKSLLQSLSNHIHRQYKVGRLKCTIALVIRVRERVSNSSSGDLVAFSLSLYS